MLTEQIAVMDLMALGRFVLQREDDLNLAALAALAACAVSAKTICSRSAMAAAAPSGSRLTEQKNGAAFEAAHIFLAEMLARADYAPPFEFYTHALTALGKKRDLHRPAGSGIHRRHRGIPVPGA